MELLSNPDDAFVLDEGTGELFTAKVLGSGVLRPQIRVNTVQFVIILRLYYDIQARTCGISTKCALNLIRTKIFGRAYKFVFKLLYSGLDSGDHIERRQKWARQILM